MSNSDAVILYLSVRYLPTTLYPLDLSVEAVSVVIDVEQSHAVSLLVGSP